MIRLDYCILDISVNMFLTCLNGDNKFVMFWSFLLSNLYGSHLVRYTIGRLGVRLTHMRPVANIYIYIYIYIYILGSTHQGPHLLIRLGVDK